MRSGKAGAPSLTWSLAIALMVVRPVCRAAPASRLFERRLIGLRKPKQGLTPQMMRETAVNLTIVSSAVTGGASLVIVILEFYRRLPGESAPVVLATEKRHFETPAVAVLYAQGALNNVVFEGVAADRCLVKTRRGALICELSRQQLQR